MGTYIDALVTAVLGAPAHAPAEHGCAPSHRTVSWGCIHTPQPSVLWKVMYGRKMKQVAGNDSVLTHREYVPQSLSCYMTNWALQKQHYVARWEASVIGILLGWCTTSFVFYSSLFLPISC